MMGMRAKKICMAMLLIVGGIIDVVYRGKV